MNTTASRAGLEAQLGVRLFHRTTRSLSLTPEGRGLFASCNRSHRSSQFSDQVGVDRRLRPVGCIEDDGSKRHRALCCCPFVAELIADNPALRVDMTLSDSVVDIAVAGLDVAVRVAVMKPSGMIATSLADNPITLCASPSYVARFGEPGTAGELAEHRCIKLHAIEIGIWAVFPTRTQMPACVRAFIDALRTRLHAGEMQDHR